MTLIAKNSIKILLVIFIVLFGVFIWQIHHNDFRHTQKTEAYIFFKSKDPALDFTFEYPLKGWTPKESKGAAQVYNAVLLVGPVDVSENEGAYISVTVKPIKLNESNAGPLALFLAQAERLGGFQIKKNGKVLIENKEYPIATYEYFVRLPLWSPRAKNVFMNETTSFVVRNNKNYRITYSGTHKQSKMYESVFTHVLETFKFLD